MNQSSYQEALEWITSHPGTSGSVGLAKLVLSLWNHKCCYSVRECIHGFDATREDLALRMVAEFMRHGETPELIRIGHEVNEYYDRLWPIALAGERAKHAQMRDFQDADDRQLASLDDE